MRRSTRVLILIAVSFITFTTVSSAEERQGFIKRLLKLPRQTTKTDAGPTAEKTAAKAVPADNKKIVRLEEPAIPGAEEKTVDNKPAKEITQQEFVQHLEETLDYDDEALGAIPELKKEEGGFYTYNGVKLEDLDREKLNTVFSRIQNEIGRIRTERLNQQLESIRQAQQANMAAQQAARIPAVFTLPPKPPQVPQPPPSPPQIPMTPQVPQPPPNPPQVPRQPPQPPAPPRR
ncbi:MAG: hypothetical protein Q8N91_01330 [Candidatus Omnitrophota bacterium]|nr:hypothetical protein [Candidatus Omnitrophota bacterium]